ncbi:MAG: AI-2E family transporter [Acidimicrobiales bacterium]
MAAPPETAAPPRVHPVVDRLAAYSWRLLVLAAALAGVLWLLGRLRIVLIPLVLTLFLSRVLAGPAAWLRRQRWPRGLAAAAVLLGFLGLLAGGVALIGAAVADEVDDLGPALSQAVDDMERWLVEDSPFDVDRSDIERWREALGDAVRTSLRTSGGAVVSRAILVVEVVVGLILGLIMTFFALKDGDRFLAWTNRLVPARRRELAAVMGRQAWTTLGGYLRGAALLGVLEGVVIGLALTLTGAKLAVPVAVLTFMAAFVPFVGAIVAGGVAVLVALGTAGVDAALVILIVAVVVQQLDNDLLAPVVYGRALNLHPVVVLLGITAGGALFGLPGSFLAVPVTAVGVNVASAVKAYLAGVPPEEAGGPAPAGAT